MSLDLSYVLEKNKTCAGRWPELLEINIPGLETIRLVNDFKNLIWNGHTWQAFPFRLEEITEDGKSLPQLNLTVSNVDRLISTYLEGSRGATGARVTFYVVHAQHLDLVAPAVQVSFSVQQTLADEQWVTFVLGPGTATQRRIPERVYLKDFCPYKDGDVECGRVVTGGVHCNHTGDSCKSLGNYARFGGEPGLLGGGMYAST